MPKHSSKWGKSARAQKTMANKSMHLSGEPLFSLFFILKNSTFQPVFCCITMLISIIFDFYDVYQYSKGENTFNWGAS